MKKCPQCGKEFQTTHTLCPFDGAVLQRADDALIGTTLAGKYRIEELINEGGMGAVYRGTHVLMDKTVAVKVLHLSLAADDKIVARFSREARAASRISHPHALSVTDFGESDDGVVFLVMEYLSGKTLKDVIHSEGPFTLSRSAEIIRQVSAALDAAHAQGVVHRDLKSDNIMLVDLDDHSDWAKVLDFGIAKIKEPLGQDPELTAPNLIIGTPQYMSPEQCSQSSEIDARSDIYSLGIILYEMLAGHVPFTGDSPTAVMMKHLQDPVPSIREERSDIPESVDELVKKAMAKMPEDRYVSAGELAAALASVVTAEISAAPGVETAANEKRITDRIVVSTSPDVEKAMIEPDDADEATVVRQRPPFEQSIPAAVAAGSPAAAFNPWKIIFPSIIGLVVIFGVVFALRGQSDTESSANENAAPLAVDPNSTPVKPAPPPTGEAEQGIASSVPTSSPALQDVPAAAVPGASSPVDESSTPGTVPPDFNVNGENSRGDKNSNTDSGAEDNSENPPVNGNANNGNQSRPSNRNTNRPVTDEPPPPAVDDDTPPKPASSPSGNANRRPPIPKPTQIPSGPSSSDTGTEPEL